MKIVLVFDDEEDMTVIVDWPICPCTGDFICLQDIDRLPKEIRTRGTYVVDQRAFVEKSDGFGFGAVIHIEPAKPFGRKGE